MRRPDRRRQEVQAEADSDIAPACRLNEHALCDGNHDLPGVPGGIPVPLTRCACSCHRRL
jgi:hypothetical protein